MANVERLFNHQDALDIKDSIDALAEAMLPPKSYSWASAEDADIVEAVQKAYTGEVDLYQDYGWTVGDERVVRLNQLPAGDYNYFHDYQEATLILLDYDHFYLADGVTKCKYVVGLKAPLLEGEKMEADQTQKNSWADTRMRKCCDAIFDTMFPASLKPIFKKFQVKTGIAGDNVNIETYSNSYLALPAYYEIFGVCGSTGNGDLPTTAEQNSTSYFRWYDTLSKISESMIASQNHWTRSPAEDKTTTVTYINYLYNGSTMYRNDQWADYGGYIRPFGVI